MYTAFLVDDIVYLPTDIRSVSVARVHAIHAVSTDMGVWEISFEVYGFEGRYSEKELFRSAFEAFASLRQSSSV